MDFFLHGLRDGMRLLFAGDADVLAAARVTLGCSLTAVAAATVLGAPAGLALAALRPRGTRAALVLARAGMGVPTVLLGLLGYALFSRRGPLGPLDLLYTPAAIILCEVLLAWPMIVALAHSAAAAVDPLARETALTLGGGRWRALLVVAAEARSGVAGAVLAAFGRVATELGIALMVGGNLKGQTRTLTTAVALDTSRGDFARAVALGTILLALAALAATGSLVCERRREG